MLTIAAAFFESDETVSELPSLLAKWQSSGSLLSTQLANMQKCGVLPDAIDADLLMTKEGMALGGDNGDRAVLQPLRVELDPAMPGAARVIIEFASGNLRFLNGYGAKDQLLRQSVAGWKLEFLAGINDQGGLVLHAAQCCLERASLVCDNMALKDFFVAAVTEWLRGQAKAVLAHTASRYAVIPRGDFLRHYLRPLLQEPLQARLDELPDFVHSRAGLAGELKASECINEKSGTEATLYNGARAGFVPTRAGWQFRDHVLLHWQEANRTLHDRESEQDVHCTLALSSQPGEDGRAHPTLDIISTLTRYEWDSVKQELPASRQRAYMGKAWARATLQWSLRLQWVAGADGHIRMTVQERKSMPRTDAGTTGIYVVSDPLPHLINVHRMGQWWDNHPASLVPVRDELAAPMAAATGSVFERIALALAPDGNRHCRSLRINERGDIEMELGE
jgi:hypothetical protein